MFCLEVGRGCGVMCNIGRSISSSDELGLGGRHVFCVMPAEVSVRRPHVRGVGRRQRGAWRAPLRAEARMARPGSGARRPWRG